MGAGNEEIIEMEVVEIDGVAVQPRRPVRGETPDARGGIDWSVWHGRVKRLDARWWPVWLVFGFIALVVAVAVGMCVAVIYVAWRIFKAMLQGFASLVNPQR